MPLLKPLGMPLELFSVAGILTRPGVDHALWLLSACQNRYVHDGIRILFLLSPAMRDACYLRGLVHVRRFSQRRLFSVFRHSPGASRERQFGLAFVLPKLASVTPSL